MKTKNNQDIIDWGTIGICLGIGCFIIVFVVLYVDNQRVVIDGNINCNTGFIGLDIEANNIIQNKTCDYDGNFTCFMNDLQLAFIKLKNIDGLNCDIEYSIDVPFSIIDKLE